METTPNLGLGLLDVGQSQKELTVNEALSALDALQAGVKSRGLGTPPVSPSDGDCYIIGPSPTGAWAGLADRLTYYLSGWRFLAPKSGMNLWVADESLCAHYTGSAWLSSRSPAGRRNAIINGHFLIWQRGISFTANGYGADRWSHDFGTGGAGTLSRQPFTLGQTAVEGEPAYFLRLAQSTSGTAPNLSQKIEDVRSLAGRKVTLSFSVRGAAAFTLTPALIQSFGSGGSPSASITQTGTNVSVGTGWTRITQSFTLPGLSGKVLGTNNDDALQLKFALPTGSTFTFDLAQVQLETGADASAFSAAPLAEELLLCQRYYENLRAYLSGYAAAAAATLAAPLGWAVEKRATPSATNLGSLVTSVNTASLALDNLASNGGRYLLTATASGQCNAGTLFGVDAEL